MGSVSEFGHRASFERPPGDRAALDQDYRLAALARLVTPVVFANVGIPPMVWWSHLERIMLAIDDLGCRGLLA